jgi:hypothetical protein
MPRKVPIPTIGNQQQPFLPASPKLQPPTPDAASEALDQMEVDGTLPQGESAKQQREEDAISAECRDPKKLKINAHKNSELVIANAQENNSLSGPEEGSLHTNKTTYEDSISGGGTPLLAVANATTSLNH